MEVTFEVPGQPRGKERPRWTMVSSTAIVYTPRNTRGYEDMIRTYYQVKSKGAYERVNELDNIEKYICDLLRIYDGEVRKR